MSTAVIWVITSLLLGVGLMGTIIPLLPGLALVVAGFLFYGLATGFSTISGLTVALLCAGALGTFLVAQLSSGFGAKIAGGGRSSFVGTVLGAIIGAFMGPLGLLVGAVIGGLIGALHEGHSMVHASRIAVWAVLGTISGSLMQFLLGSTLVIIFLIAALA
jgi:uncharacterized protein YqgC (DUF456 family)